MKLAMILEQRGNLFWIAWGAVLSLAIGIVDYLTGYEVALSLFYLIPISLVTWYTTRTLGIAISLISATIWFLADSLSGHPYSNPFIIHWNTLIRFCFFAVTTTLLSSLRDVLRRERESSRIDYLTGAANSRNFYELMDMEISRALRYNRPFTVAYVDLDNFKSINDRLGHKAGDEVLRTVVNTMTECLRKVDVVARLGGDEFALLMPETGQAAAHVALSKMQKSLLMEMQRNAWPVTFSIGAVTWICSPCTPDELIREADGLMYNVKNTGKNSIGYSVFAGPVETEPHESRISGFEQETAPPAS